MPPIESKSMEEIVEEFKYDVSLENPFTDIYKSQEDWLRSALRSYAMWCVENGYPKRNCECEEGDCFDSLDDKKFSFYASHMKEIIEKNV